MQRWERSSRSATQAGFCAAALVALARSDSLRLLQHNEEAISKMLASIAEMEAAVVEDGLQDAKRERLLMEEQRRARDVTLRLTEALQALALLRRKYGETEGEETAGSASALRDEVLRLRDTVKAEQAAAHRELHNTRAAVQPAG